MLSVRVAAFHAVTKNRFFIEKARSLVGDGQQRLVKGEESKKCRKDSGPFFLFL